MSPLHVAAVKGFADVCKVLLDAKADVDAQAARHDVCIRLFENVLLIFCRISCVPWGTGLQTPLHCSASNGHLDVCKVLLDAKANVNATDTEFDCHL